MQVAALDSLEEFRAGKTQRRGAGEVVDEEVRIDEDHRFVGDVGKGSQGHSFSRQNGRNSSLSATSLTSSAGAGIIPRVSATAPGKGVITTRSR